MLRTHLNALLTNFELIALAGVISLSADFIWVCHDVLVNGMSISYGLIAFGLITGIILTSIVWFRHNWNYTLKLEKIKELTNFYRRNG